MKKLFTLVALLACFLGAKAEWVEDYKIDYSTKTNFPFYVMGFVPEWVNGVMVDYGADFRYETQEALDGDGDGKWKDGESSVGTAMAGNTEYQKVTGAGPYWHQYIIAADVPMELDGNYTVKAVVKASAEVQANLQFGNWGKLKETGVKIPAGDDFQEVEWEVSGCLNSGTGFICIQPGASQATIEWKSLTVGHTQKTQRPTVWKELLTSDGQPVVIETTSAAIPTYMGNAETPWADANVKFDDATKSNLICAWGKENGRNKNDDGGSDPFPCDIVELSAEDGGGHAFIVHAKDCTDPTADASAWDNQFWIMSTKELKVGSQYKVQFRYKASQPAKTNTQMHSIQPSDYLHWAAVGDISFTTQWQEFETIWTVGEPQNKKPIYSIAFNLNPDVKTATDFYFDDLSIQEMKLDEGYFVAGSNKDEGLDYDLDNAIPFEVVTGNDDYNYVATVGEKNAYVSEIMISTVRGNDAAFKANTLKLKNAIVNDPDEWNDYSEASLTKLPLPGVGIWKIYLDTDTKTMAFEMLEGKEKEAIDVVTNPTNIIVKGQERDDLSDTKNDAGERTGREEEGGAGETWDNQFFFVANRELEAKEVTHLKFSYKASKAAKTTTQSHAAPGGYIHWAAIGDVNFTEEWQTFDNDVIIDDACAGKGMKSIAFNMAEIKEACDYEIKDVQWYIKDESLDAGKTWENLIDATGAKNFYVKEGAGTSPHEFVPGTDGISNVVKNAKTSAVIYNLAGQRVSNSFKGIVIKDGKKVVK